MKEDLLSGVPSFITGMTAQHTPGEWKAEKFCVWAGDRYVAATQTGLRADEQQANARLIASAPKLLEALKNLVECLQCHSGVTGLTLDAVLTAQAAIAKAEGGEPVCRPKS